MSSTEIRISFNARNITKENTKGISYWGEEQRRRNWSSGCDECIGKAIPLISFCALQDNIHGISDKQILEK